ncbi:hypothetical protein GGP60_003377 [Salinibacter ruber]|nr:hypothetical protein [Salinibacter ruber]
MESIFGNRRHWQRADFWSSKDALRRRAARIFRKVPEPIVGNKVCTPDVWTADDIHCFCRLFQDFEILSVVRDPRSVLISRYQRTDYETEFNSDAREQLLFDFRTPFHAHASSWRQSIEVYRTLHDRYPDRVKILYYDDFAANFNEAVDDLPNILGLEPTNELRHWNEKPHYDREGELQRNLKYPDRNVQCFTHAIDELPSKVRNQFEDAMQKVETYRELWEHRSI